MRKNLAKHTAKKLPLAKRVLALCFALIFVCSCLLPAFANGTGEGLDTPDTEVVEAADPGTEPEPMDLYDEPAAMDDDFAVADEPAAMDDDFAVADEPAAMDDQVEKPVVDDEPAAMDNEVEKPVEGGEPPVADDTPAEEGATKTTTDASGNIVYEYDTSGTTFPEDDAAALPDGDQVLDQMDAAFSIPTNIYHFWLKKMSSYDLADIATDAEAAEMTVEQYLAMYGTDKGCYHIMTAADGANLKDYQFADPTSNDDPEGNSRTFAGWYYTDELGDEQKFVFDEHLYVSEGTTMEVYAKWMDEENLDGEQKQEETAPEELTAAMEDGISVNATGNLPEGAKSLSVEAVAESDDEKTLSNIENALGTLSDQYGAWTIYSFDIKILDADGNELQPTDGDVTLSIQGLDLMDETRVVHVHNTVSAVATQSAGPRRAAAHRSSTEQLDATAYGDTVEFTTPNFSNFYVVSGDTRQSPNGWYDVELLRMNKNSGSTVYVAPGTKLQFETDDSHTSGNWTFVGTKSNSISFAADQNGNWGQSNGYKTVEIALNAQPGDTATLQVKTGSGYWARTYTRKLVVMSQEDVIRHAWALDQSGDNAYPVFLAVKRDSTDMPSEPGVTRTGGYYYFLSNLTGDDTANIYATTAKNVVNIDQFLARKAVNQVDGTTTVGVADSTGFNTKAALKIDIWEGLLANIYTYYGSQFKTQDGKWLSSFNSLQELKNGYELIPYVVKLQTSTVYSGYYLDRGWHIDCAIVPKQRITLSYDAGLDGEFSNFKIADLKLPSPVISTTNPCIATVGNPQKGDQTINDGDVVECLDGTKLKFLGWKDREDKAEDSEDQKIYKPNENITFSEDMTLYGVWEKLSNDLTITKNVTGLMGDHSKDFNFMVKVERYDIGEDNVGSWNDVTNSITYEGTVTGGTFTLKHSDSIKLKGLSGKYRITLTENLDDAEYKTTATGYLDEKTSGREYTYYAQIGSDGTVQLSTPENGEYNLGNTIEVVNNKTIDPDMGVLLDTLPYILILVVVAGGGVLLFLRKRKNDDDE